MKTQVDISHRISPKLFWFVTLMIITLPITTQYRLLIFGEYTTGEVVGVEYEKTLGISAFGPDKYPIIVFTTLEGKSVQFYGPENFEYPKGTMLKVVYSPNNPTDCMVFSFGALYTDRKAIIPGILFLLWMAFYLAFRNKK
ncbi:hypothetical protein [Tenuifilum sp.]|uniref:hypothetical protein n=1 Tax=Tenuifilum sp. TaxID=2760880 RepID=UPI002C3801E0|nr:hypothetical protein [Tenuifilum sp.]HPP89097.1 hypothetical protein [Tenuifilum sp.]